MPYRVPLRLTGLSKRNGDYGTDRLHEYGDAVLLNFELPV